MLGIDRRAARIVWTVALVAGSLYVLFLVRKTLFVFALALFISYLISPLVHVLQRYRKGALPRIFSVAAAFLLVIVVIVVGISLIGPTISEQGSELLERLPTLAASMNSVDHIKLPAILEPWRDRLSGILRQLVAGATASAIPFASSVVKALLGAATDLVFLVIIPILSFLFLKDGPTISRTALRSIELSNRQKIVRIGADVHEVLGQYVRALGLLSLATFIVYGGVFVIIGVPFGVLLAALAALLEFIPVIGPLTAAGLALLVALMAGYEHLAWLACFVIFYRIFQDYVLAPRLISTGVGLSPVLVIFGFLAGEQLAGIPGMFLAIPILAVLRIIVASIEPGDSTMDANDT